MSKLRQTKGGPAGAEMVKVLVLETIAEYQILWKKIGRVGSFCWLPYCISKREKKEKNLQADLWCLFLSVSILLSGQKGQNRACQVRLYCYHHIKKLPYLDYIVLENYHSKYVILIEGGGGRPGLKIFADSVLLSKF